MFNYFLSQSTINMLELKYQGFFYDDELNVE